jgi:hypothetical protein
MTTLKVITIAAGLLVGGTSLAMAQYAGWMGTRQPHSMTTRRQLTAPLRFTITQLQLMRHRPRQERPLLS